MDQIKENFKKIATQAQNDHAQVELLYKESESLNLSFKKKKLDKYESIQSQIAGLRVIINNSQGYAYTENLNAESLLNCYNQALLNAKSLKPSSSIITLPKGEFDQQNLENDADSVSILQKKELAQKLEENCYELASEVQSVPYVGLREFKAKVRILNNLGLDREFSSAGYSCYTYPLAKSSDKAKMGGENFFTRNFKEISAKNLTEKAVEKAVAKLKAKTLKTGNYATVILKDEFAMMIQMFESYFSAKNIFEEKSLFKNKLNSQIASPLLTVIDDPTQSQYQGYTPFDSEGCTTEKTILIENGILKCYLTNLEYAQKMNLPHTKNASRSPVGSMDISSTQIIIEKGSSTLDELINSNATTLVITEFTGGLHAGFKSSTGDFSLPAEGFLYEKGQRVGAVDQFVVSGNILNLMQDIVGLSNELSQGSSGYVNPDVLIKSLSFAGEN